MPSYRSLGVGSQTFASTLRCPRSAPPRHFQTDEYADGATPWQEQALLIGQALGREEEAQQLVDDVESQVEQAVTENPDFAGSSIAVDLTGVGSGHYLLGRDDLRTQSSMNSASPSPTPAPTSARSGWTC